MPAEVFRVVEALFAVLASMRSVRCVLVPSCVVVQVALAIESLAAACLGARVASCDALAAFARGARDDAGTADAGG